MVRHIVLFKLKKTLDEAARLDVGRRFKEAIEALPAEIPQIIAIQVGLNVNPSEDWDIALVSDFQNLEDVAAYSKHPSHVRAAQILKDAKDSRSCVDYEF